MKVSAIRIGLSSDLCAAYAARIVVLVAVWQYQEQGLAHRVCRFAAGAEKAGRFKLAKAIRHAVILDHHSSLVSVAHNATHHIQPLVFPAAGLFQPLVFGAN